mmetsp:Transcript_11734/g.32687  ORF Transcript_11734/g.32687 Transcript_11734/m.32687 type:complete len:95 (+) Transcript_11734:411-695(+)
MQDLAGDRDIAIRAVTFAVDCVLNGGAVHCARRFLGVVTDDISVRPDMEAIQKVPGEMNRLGMPDAFRHDEGVAPHDAGFLVTGPRRPQPLALP